jgi:hypothetical protein
MTDPEVIRLVDTLVNAAYAHGVTPDRDLSYFHFKGRYERLQRLWSMLVQHNFDWKAVEQADKFRYTEGMRELNGQRRFHYNW